MSTRKVSPRKAAFLSGAVLAATALGSPALLALPGLSTAANAAAPSTVVSRLSVNKGETAGGNTILIAGKGLATGSGSLTAKTVKFGSATVTSGNVTALSTSALEVVVPAVSSSSAVNVVVGDAKKGQTYTYVAPDFTVTTDQDALDLVAPSTDSGRSGVEITGTGFERATTVLVGGKPTKPTVTATKLTVALPAGLSGPQDIVVSDARGSVYVGYVTYSATTPTLTAVSSYATNEAATAVTLTGTNLTAVTGASFEGGTAEKVAFAKTTDPTKLVVTVPKGSAKTGTIKVVTKYAKNASIALERKASATPTVTAVSGAVAAGGNVTLTGTNLVGLKSVTATASGKKVAGKVVKVNSATSATVALPKLAAGSYGMVVKTNAAAGSTSYSFTVASGAPTVSATAIDSGKTTVTLTGTYLKTATKVVLTPGTGSAVTRTTGLTPNADGTSLVVVLPTALADETYGIVVTNPVGSSTAASLVVS